MAKRDKRYRCDHCQKWIADGEPVGHLEGIVSPGVEPWWCICQSRCFAQRGSDREHWDAWVKRKEADLTKEVN